MFTIRSAIRPLRRLLQTQRDGRTRLLSAINKNNKAVFGSRNFSKSGQDRNFARSVQRYWTSLKWFSIPASVGFAYICYQQFWHIRRREQHRIQSSETSEFVANGWQVGLLKTLPTRLLSRAWGTFHQVELPVFLRRPLLGLYVWAFSCDLEEAVEEDLRKYQNLGSFFKRSLKPGKREIDQNSTLVSPVDGKLLHLGIVEDDMLEQVKGIKYCLKTFLGPNHAEVGVATDSVPTKTEEQEEEKQLYHCVIYLSPGDFHWFYSPTEWKVAIRRHFPGLLLSVQPRFTRWIQGLFNHNERVVLIGSWKYGFFSYSAVGAFNVGSIEVDFDEGLKTNCPGKYAEGSFDELQLVNEETGGKELIRGQQMGAFNLGSTIVLVFEAPKDFEFSVECGNRLRLGQPIGRLSRDL